MILTPEQFKDRIHRTVGMVKMECAYESTGDKSAAAKYNIRRNEVVRELERAYADLYDLYHNGKIGGF